MTVENRKLVATVTAALAVTLAAPARPDVDTAFANQLPDYRI
jgi:hypothetical protein